ncbi:MAG: rhodanese-like domain-containing protein [Bacteroidota bacterium]|nr:rhodanese-like domain-containing protein [Bacteroidota bacterium]
MFNDIFSALRGGKTRVPNIGADEFLRLIEEHPEALVLDVRTAGEFHAGHIPGARNIDMMNPRFRDEVSGIDRESVVLLYCRSGNRSYHAGNLMIQLGFAHVYNLGSGLMEWRQPLAR